MALIEILTLCNGPLQENCYFACAPGAHEGVLIDPGSEAEELKGALARAGKRPLLLLATHAHFDHVGAVHAFAAAFGAAFACPRLDAEILEALEDSYSFYGMGSTKTPKVDQWLEGGERLRAGALELEVLATPGHSPGSLCYLHRPSLSLFSGDTLFQLSIGRADLPGGDMEALEASIRGKLYPLPEATAVYPGHGPATSIGAERAGNPFVRP